MVRRAFRTEHHTKDGPLPRGRDPLWLKALEAWVEHEYPAGANGRSAAMRVVDQVRRHVRRMQR